jgi:malonyl CoA-acyl carrier protein transacylase
VIKTAFLFPGQGAQTVGMGVALAEQFPESRKLFDRASSLLGYDLLTLCGDGPADRLNSTEHSQPALMVCSLAALEKLKENAPELVSSCNVAAGLSLGEYTALVFADAIDFDTGIRLVHQRGKAMQQASDAVPGGMVSILGLDQPRVELLCQEVLNDLPQCENHNVPIQEEPNLEAEYQGKKPEITERFREAGAIPDSVPDSVPDSAAIPDSTEAGSSKSDCSKSDCSNSDWGEEGAVLQIANLLCPSNIVVSGSLEACMRIVPLAEKAGAMRAIQLSVAGAFHTRLMQPAVEPLTHALSNATIRPPRIPVISNVDAQPHDDPDVIRSLLIEQVVRPVLWENSMRWMIDSMQVGQCYEIGPGRVLRGLLKRIARKLPCENVTA